MLGGLMAVVVENMKQLTRQAVKKAPRRLNHVVPLEYSGTMDEDVALLYQVLLIRWMAEGIDPEDPNNADMCLAQLISTFTGTVAVWIRAQLTHGNPYTSVTELLGAVRKEFEPADIQERFRYLLNNLKQVDCKGGLDEYTERYRTLMVRVTDIWTRSCTTKKELIYQETGSVTKAMTCAQRYERAFFSTSSGHNECFERRDQGYQALRLHNDAGTSAAKGTVIAKVKDTMVAKGSGKIAATTTAATARGNYNDHTRKLKHCFNCHAPGPSADECKEPKGSMNQRHKNYHVRQYKIVISEECDNWSEVTMGVTSLSLNPIIVNKVHENKKLESENINDVLEVDDDEDNGDVQEADELVLVKTSKHETATSMPVYPELIILNGKINGRNARIFLDCGATLPVSIEGFNSRVTKLVNEVA
ncbi:hypothetical protein ACHHYP_03949 [Achlya hypogyna]|uniref:Retrotransposon gag domain-containing protein n=1 Tax=Achlya hypogyna TaxID=1202772 RepID=A0A1V9ZPM0_ACHHY|nr:hypothetical protein ACHHYP_03949 [Achlya hypogyna]